MGLNHLLILFVIVVVDCNHPKTAEDFLRSPSPFKVFNSCLLHF